VLREFDPHKTHFFSLFLKTLPHHQMCLCDSLLNANETHTKTTIRIMIYECQAVFLRGP